jgi:UDP-N-acetylmuramate: L-alanyl-gamma-D-glutamyl-meso-diaminopimelate ligase
MAKLENQRIYLLPIGGTGMASLAGLLQAAGAEVTGSDGPLYPPTSTLLERLGIPVLRGFDPANLDRSIDRVVIGNAIPRTNVEAEEVLRRGIPYASMAAAIRELFLDGRHPLVITGTHGKTTTSSLVAWLLESAGRHPSFLVGGELQNFGQNFQLGTGPHFVIEGDEYNTAFFDKGAKFLHYAAKTLLVNNVELDHIDIYPDFEAVLASFRAAVAQVGAEGRIVWNFDDDGARKAAAEPSLGTKVSFSASGNGSADWRGAILDRRPEGTRVRFEGPDRFVLEATLPGLTLAGRHNLSNALAAVAMLAPLGLEPDELARGIESFRGVRRRLEIVGEPGGITVLDDFAHHPTAVRETLEAARGRFPSRRLWALFEPRSLSSGRKIFQEEYGRAFAAADRVLLAPIFYAKRLPPGEAMDGARLVADIRSTGPETTLAGSVDEIVEIATREAREGDVLLCMSSGSFEGLPKRLAETLGKE